ncbi:uncharacterized protein LOC111343207 [Stylophora pistillata]|uniref:G domain-containing protein n=1 Tax=Stylophora pistillata TaxID=50429 RepID=A0A2B4RFY6_STYPI|nr:uncharacterized protein LOC111343207 [Stylophora pistillata]PFX15719.1 hypothetical protein AWC38_SpisGene20052 [Stylophora pistillata]
MGSGKSKETHYTYVDNTAAQRREAEEREARRLENERKQRENDERLRIAREKAEEERRRREQLREQRESEIAEEEARREAEEQKRLELEAELCRRRDQLFNYKFGDKTRLDNFMGLNIEDVTQLRIGVFGPTGSGKSCFINTCERAVRETDRGSAPDSTTGQEGTITLQDYLPEMFFHLVDTRGFFNYNSNENIEFQNILFGKIQPGDNIHRSNAGESKTQEMHQCPEFRQRMHGIIIVVKANDPRLTEGALKDYLKPVRDVLRKNGIAPITVITHQDTLKTEEDEKDAFDEASAATGSSPSHTFFMWNYTKDNRSRNPEIERMTFDILHYALMTAERAVKIMKQKEKNKEEDEVMKALDGVTVSGHVAPDSADASVEVFLRFLQKEYQWSTNSIKVALSKLAKDDITTVKVLAMTWGEVRQHFPTGMSRMIEKELRKRDMIH